MRNGQPLITGSYGRKVYMDGQRICKRLVLDIIHLPPGGKCACGCETLPSGPQCKRAGHRINYLTFLNERGEEVMSMDVGLN